MSDESAVDETPPTARSGGRKSINKGRWSKDEVSTVVVLRADSPGKAAQWFAESIPES
jgi:hypothetical protein